MVNKNENSSTIAIINLGIGNLSSVSRMLEKAMGSVVLVDEPDKLYTFTKILLPGVGHFDEGMSSLQRSGFASVIKDLSLDEKTLIIGICLGMQLLCRNSEEGNMPGLGLIDADVKKFTFPPDKKLKIPHMGWNIVHPAKSNPLLPQDSEEQRFYFVHSYKLVPDDPSITIGIADYGGEFCAAFQKDNIYGVQFHPEKSHRFGMALLKRFVEL